MVDYARITFFKFLKESVVDCARITFKNLKGECAGVPGRCLCQKIYLIF